MYPTANYEIAKARVADFHRDAKRDAMARAARQPKHSSRRLSPRIPVAARRVFTVLTARA